MCHDRIIYERLSRTISPLPNGRGRVARERDRVRARLLRGACSGFCPTAGALTPAPLPDGLADSHIALRGNEGGAAFGGLELEPALEHDDGAGLAVVAGPSAEAGADPCRIGEGAAGVGVALSFGLAFEALAHSLLRLPGGGAPDHLHDERH